MSGPVKILQKTASLISRDSLSALVGISLIGKVFGSLSAFLLSVVIAQGFGAEVLGAFAVGFVLLQFGGIFARLGFDTTVRKFIPKYRSEADQAGETGLVIAALLTPFLLGSCLTITVLLFQDQLPINFNTIVEILLIGLPLHALMYVLMATTQAYKNTIYSVYIRDFAHAALSVVLIGLIVLLNFPATVAAYAYTATFGIAVLVGLFYTYRLVSLSGLQNVRYDWRNFYSFSAVAVLISVSNQFVVWSDILVLGVLSTSSATGQYQAAYQTSVLLSFLLIAVNTIFPSIISELYTERDWEHIELIYSSVTKWITYLTSMGTVLILFYPSVWLLIFGNAFREASVVLSLLAVSQWIGSSVGPAGKLLAMCGSERLEFLNAALIGIVNLGLNIVLIQRYGILGAALATAFSLSMLNLVRAIEIWHLFRITPHRKSHLLIGIPVAVTIVLVGIIRFRFASSAVSAICSALLAGVVGLVGTKYLFEPRDQLLLDSLQ